MTLVFGLALVATATAFAVISLPRKGRLAWFVGTSWETPLALAAVCGFFIGLVMIVAGWVQ